MAIAGYRRQSDNYRFVKLEPKWLPTRVSPSQRVSNNAGLIVPVGAALGLFLDPLVNVQTLCPRSPGQELLNTSATFGAGDVQCVLRAVLLVRQAWPGPLDQFGVPPVGCTRRRCITGFRLEQDLSTVERAYIWMHRLKQPSSTRSKRPEDYCSTVAA